VAVAGRKDWCGLLGFQASYTLPQLFEEDEAESLETDLAFAAWFDALKEVRGDMPANPDLAGSEDAVEVVVDIRDGAIVALLALSAYQGTLLDEVRIGMTYRDVRAIVSTDWSSIVVGQVIDGVDDVSLHFDGDEVDVSEDHRRDLVLDTVGVFLSDRTDNGYIGL
jgi:hypothetical protein